MGAGCYTQVDNEVFSAVMEHFDAFGSANEIDIMDGSCPAFGPGPVRGETKLALAYQVDDDYDGLTLELTEAIREGDKYCVVAYLHCNSNSGAELGGVRVGLTSSNTEGTPVLDLSCSILENGWECHDGSFVAPADATHVSLVPLSSGSKIWVHIDNMFLKCCE